MHFFVKIFFYYESVSYISCINYKDMRIELEHPFIWNSHNMDELLFGTKKISTFCRKLENQAILYPNRYDSEKYKGDGLEFLAEAIIKLSPVDNRIGIGGYHPELNSDTGVDGYGIGIDGNPATVQVKYRSESRTLLTANEDHLSNFVMTSLIRYKVPADTKTNLLVITTAEGLHYFTDNEMFQNQVRCLGYKHLRELLDNNLLFWNSLRELVKNKKNEIKGSSI